MSGASSNRPRRLHRALLHRFGCSSKVKRFDRTFTLLELLVVLVIIGILVTLSLPVISGMRARAQRAQCTANLRSLYVATESYIQQNGSWPQIPISDSDAAEQEYALAWIAALKPFGPTQQTWICPTIQNLSGNPDLSNPDNVRIDYIATSFDDKPTTPHQWPRQPWFGEVGDVHGNGNLIVFTDGSISDLKTVAGRVAPAPTP
jgi:prepilin-type N-terminal cleavage/methylation domain-containing protein